MARLVLIASALASGCYSPQLADCTSTCATSGACPAGTTCVAGVCRLEGAIGACPADPGVDGSIEFDGPPPPDGSPPPDGPMSDGPAVTCPPAPVMQGCAVIGPVVGVAPGCFVVCAAKSWPDGDAVTAGTWHMAVLTTAQEVTDAQAALTAAGVTKAWIGLDQPPSQATPGTAWRWTTATAFAFDVWASGQPDDADNTENNNQNCAAMQNGEWLDEPCQTMQPFLMEPF